MFAAKFSQRFTGRSNPPRFNVGEPSPDPLERFLPLHFRGGVFVLPEVECFVQG
jgi:hypothetical protein